MPSKRNTVPGLLTHSTTLEHRKSSIISGCHDRCFFLNLAVASDPVIRLQEG